MAGGDEIVLSGATVPANGSCFCSVDVVASRAGHLTNTIGADAIWTDQSVTKLAPATADLEVLPLPLPMLSEVFSLVVILAGALVTDLGSNASAAEARLSVRFVAVAIPVMPYWGLLLLTGLLVAIAGLQFRQRTR